MDNNEINEIMSKIARLSNELWKLIVKRTLQIPSLNKFL